MINDDLMLTNEYCLKENIQEDSTLNVLGFNDNFDSTNRRRLKRTTVNIDSINRIKEPIISKKLLGFLPINPLKSEAGSRDIKVWCPYEELLNTNGSFTGNLRYPQFQSEDIGRKEIIFMNLQKDINDDNVNGYNYYKIGLKREYIEFDRSDILKKIFIIKEIGYRYPLEIIEDNIYTEKKKYKSDYFIIRLNERINSSQILTAEFGGENVIINEVSSFKNGYENSAHYKIDLKKEFKNIYMVKLKNIVIPNTSYTINSREERSDMGNFNVKTKVNNKLKWINRSDRSDIYNLSLYSDKVFSNSISLENLISEVDNLPEQSNKQKNYNDDVIKRMIDENTDLLSLENRNRKNELKDEFIKLSNIENIDKEYFLYSIIHTDDDLNENISSNKGKYWLPNCYHNFTKTLIYILFESITKPYYTENQYLNYNLKNISKDNVENFSIAQRKIYNRNIWKLLRKEGWYYYYLNSLLNNGNNNLLNNERRSLNNSIHNLLDFEILDDNLKNYKYLDELDIPKYMGYYIFERILEDGQKDSIFNEELVENKIENGKYICPGNNYLSEKILSPTLVPDTNLLELKSQTRYPIYEVSLTDGKYNTKSFIKELQNKLSGTYKKKYNGVEQRFENEDYSIEKFDFQPIFNIDVNKNLNFIDIRQYSPITKFRENTAFNPNLIYYNEGIPLVAIKLNGHSLNNGDKIFITGCSDADNIEEEHINGEHIVKVKKSFKIFLRLIYPLPNLEYLDQNKYFENSIGKDFEIDDKTLEYKLKRDIRKFLLKPNDLDKKISNKDIWYGGNWERENSLHESLSTKSEFDNKPIIWEGYMYENWENSENTVGNAAHSKKEIYPLRYISNDFLTSNLNNSWNNPHLDSKELRSDNYNIMEGDLIERKISNGDWKAGKVLKINNDNSYNLIYNDNEIEEGVLRNENSDIKLRIDLELYGEIDRKGNINKNELYPRSWNNVYCYNKSTKPEEIKRYYGKFTSNIPYKFGIYHSSSNIKEINNFIEKPGNIKEFEPKSQKHLNDGNLTMSKKNVIVSAPSNREFTMIDSNKSETLKTNLNYLGSKMINSVNNDIMYPENSTSFNNKNSLDADGVECSLLLNETFMKLSDMKNITEKTIIGRITQINNNKRLNNNGNYEVYFDLITEIESGNFNIGDIIVGLDSNCICMIVPETWDYLGLLEDDVIYRGYGTYILEKYRNIGSINKIISKATNTYKYKERDIDIDLDIISISEWKDRYNPELQGSDDLNRFLKEYKDWNIEESPYSSQYIYISIDPIIPSISRIVGIKTTNLVISKPVEFKFIFDKNTSPIDRLNIPTNQSFNFSQNNLKKFNEININKSYLLGLYENSVENYLVVETFEKLNFKKNDIIYIENHKITNRNIENNKIYNLTIESVEPFRNYLEFIRNNYSNDIIFNLNEFDIYFHGNKNIDIRNLSEIEKEQEKRIKYNHNKDNIYPVPFSNINIIWDYNINTIKYCIGENENIGNSYSIDYELHNNYKTENTNTIICISKPIQDYYLPLYEGDVVRQYYDKDNPVIVACGTIKNFISGDKYNVKRIINVEIENVSGTFIANTENYDLNLILDIRRVNRRLIIINFASGNVDSNPSAVCQISVNDRIIQGKSKAKFLGKTESLSKLIFEVENNSTFNIGISATPVYIERLSNLNEYNENSQLEYQEICPSLTYIESLIDPYLDDYTNGITDYDVIKIVKSNINELDTDAYEQLTELKKNEDGTDWMDIKNITSDYEKVYSKSTIYSGTQPNKNLNNLNLVQRGPFELFNNSNLSHFGIRERIINWFFENPFNWNSYNLEKVLEFKKKYEPSIENKNIILKLIVSPLDTYGWNFLKNGIPTFIKRGGDLSEYPYKGSQIIPFKDRPREGGYIDDNNIKIKRNSDNILPFLKGMGVYINNPFLEKYKTQESIKKFQNQESDTPYIIKLIDPFWDYERNSYIGEVYSLNTVSDTRNNIENKYPAGWIVIDNNEEIWLGNYSNVINRNETENAIPKLHNYLKKDPLQSVIKRPVSGLVGYVLDTSLENIEDYINNFNVKSYCLDVSTITKQKTQTIWSESEITRSNTVITEDLIGKPTLDCSVNTYPPEGDISKRSYEYSNTGNYKNFETLLNNRNEYDYNKTGSDDNLGVIDTYKSIFSINPFYNQNIDDYTYNEDLPQYPDAYLIKELKKYRDDGTKIDQNQHDLNPYRKSDWKNVEKPYKFSYTRQRWWVEKQLCNFNYVNNIEIDSSYPEEENNNNIDLFTWQNLKPEYIDKSKIYIKQSLNYINDTRYQHHKSEYISNSYLNNDINNPNYKGIMSVEVISEFDGSYGLDSDYKKVKGINKNLSGGIGVEFIISKNFYSKFPTVSISNPGVGYDVGDIIEIIAEPNDNQLNGLKNYAFFACKINTDEDFYNNKSINFYTGDTILINESSIYPAVKGIIPFNQTIIQNNTKLIIKMQTSTVIKANTTFKWTKINEKHGIALSNENSSIINSVGSTVDINVYEVITTINNDSQISFYPIQNLQVIVKEIIVSNSLIGPSRLVCNLNDWNQRGICEGYINTYNDNTYRHNDIKDIVITKGGGKYSPFLFKTIKKQTIEFLTYQFDDSTRIKTFPLSFTNPLNIIQKTNSNHPTMPNKILAHGQIIVGNALKKPPEIIEYNTDLNENIDFEIDRNELIVNMDKIRIIFNIDINLDNDGKITATSKLNNNIITNTNTNENIGIVYTDVNVLGYEIVVKLNNNININIGDIIEFKSIDGNLQTRQIFNIINYFSLNVSIIKGLFINEPNSKIYFEYYEKIENNIIRHTNTENPITISNFNLDYNTNKYTNTLDSNFSKNFKFVFAPQPKLQKINGNFYPNNNENWLHRSQWWDGTLPDPQEWGDILDYVLIFNSNIIDVKKNYIITQKDINLNIIAYGSIKYDYNYPTNKLEINIIYGTFLVDQNLSIYINNFIENNIQENIYIISTNKNDNFSGIYNPKIQYKQEIKKIIPSFQNLSPNIDNSCSNTYPTSWRYYENSSNLKNNYILGAHNGDFKAWINLIDYAPTYAMYLLINEDSILFKEDDWIESTNSINYNNLQYLTRGTNIFYNIDKLKKNNTVNNNQCDQYDTDIETIGSDSKTYGNYSWRNRQAVATIFQGILEKNDASLYDNYPGTISNPNEYYSLPFIPRQNSDSNTIYKEVSIINSEYEVGGLKNITKKTYKKIFVHTKPNKIYCNASIKYNQSSELIEVNDYNNLYYDFDVSGNENYRKDPHDKKYKSLAEFTTLYGKEDGKIRWDDSENYRIDPNDNILKTYNQFLEIYQNNALLQWNLSASTNVNTNIIKPLFNNFQKINHIILGKKYIKPIYIISAHLDYFYKNYLQNKSILNLSKPYDKISKDTINNLQTHMESKTFYLSSDSKYNNFDFVNKYDNSNIPFESRNNLINFENIDYLPLDSKSNIYIYDHNKNVAKYTDIASSISIGDSSSIQNCTNLSTNTSFNIFETNYEKETVGIADGRYNILTSLWHGNINNSIIYNKYKPGRSVLSDIEFTDKIEKGSLNKGYIRVKTKNIDIVGNNSKSYMNNYEQDCNTEFTAYISFDKNKICNTKGSNKLKLIHACINNNIGTLDNMFQENDLLFIGSNIHSKDDNNNYKTNKLNSILNNSEIGIVKSNPNLIDGTYIEVELKNNLINNHNYENNLELVISRYKYGELFEEGIHTKDLFENYIDSSNYNRFIWNSHENYIHYIKDSNNIHEQGFKEYYDPIQYPYLIKIKKFIGTTDYTNSVYLDVGDIICLDWARERYVDYINTEERLPPFNVIPDNWFDSYKNILDQYKNKIKGKVKKIYTQQFNRVLKKVSIKNSQYIMIMLEKRPFIHYPADTPFIILKQTYRNNIHNTNLNKQSTINYSCLSTQPFIYNNEWYTKIFYQGEKSITTSFQCNNFKLKENYLNYIEKEKTYNYEYKHRLYSTMHNFDKNNIEYKYKKYENDNIDNDMRQGYKMFNNNLKKNVYIHSMKGIDIPYIPIPNNSNDDYYNNLSSNNLYNSIIQTNNVSPIHDSNISTEPVFIEDFHNIIENQSTIPIFGKNYYYTELFEKYLSTNEKNISNSILDKLLSNYNNNNNHKYWEDYYENPNVNFRNQMLYCYEDVLYSDKFYTFLESILYDEYYNYDENNQFVTDNINENLYNLLENSNHKNYDYKPINYNFIIVKGIYLGYGGIISERDTHQTNIINNPDGWKVIEVLNENTINKPNKIIIDLKKSLLNFDKSFLNSSNKIYSKLNSSLSKLPSGIFDFNIQLNNLETNIFNNTKIIGTGGTIYMQKLSAPLNLIGNNYIYLCIPEFQGQMETSSNKIINSAFAKILLPGETNQTLFNTFSLGVKEFPEPLTSLDSIEICFLTDDNYLFDFNGLEHSFVIEIYEIIDYV